MEIEGKMVGTKQRMNNILFHMMTVIINDDACHFRESPIFIPCIQFDAFKNAIEAYVADVIPKPEITFIHS